MPRFDLIPQCAWYRLAERFTGDVLPNGVATGGAYKYGESNWELGLPTSDTINHILHHITNYQEKLRRIKLEAVNRGMDNPVELMEYVRQQMIKHSEEDDDLAGAMWGICVLMRQEDTKMYHDDKFEIKLAAKKPIASNLVATD